MVGEDEGMGRRGRLPQELSSFVGRTAELAAVEDRLVRSRLVNLTGPGGSGKSRLALRVAAAVAPRFPDVQLVELAPLVAGALVPATVAQALGLKDRAGGSPVDHVAEAVGGRELLLILDNCEHVIEEAARLVLALVERCPGIRILATSRQRLDVPGEVVFPVLPLSLPGRLDRSVEHIASAESVMLFVDRASAVEPTFQLTEANAAAVAEICSHLDGIPLAIELAAARVRVLSPRDIAAHLSDRFGLLAGGPGAPPRHKSLRALVQWSYDLLSEEEQQLLARLSVFRDGFELSAAAAVAGSEPLSDPSLRAGQTVVVLAGLVDRSLVHVQHEPTTRYSLLETIRSFATDRLDDLGEGPVVRRRHLEWVVAIARAAEAELGGPEWQRWSSRLATEQGNTRAALDWALAGPGVAAPLGRELAARLGRWWFVTGRYTEGRQFLLRALEGAADEPIDIRARLAVAAGWCTYHLGDAPEAEELGLRGLDEAAAAGDAFGAAWARILLAGLAWSAGDGARVHELLAGAAEWTAIPGATALAARASVLLSNVTFVAGDLAEARRLGVRATKIARTAPGRENLALALICTTHPALVEGDLAAAERLADEALATAIASGDRFAETIAYYQRARMFAVRGQADRADSEARRCWEAGRAGGVRLVEALAPVADSVSALAAGRVDDGDAALQRAVDGGRAMGFTAFEPGWLAQRACLAARLGHETTSVELLDEAEAALGDREERLTRAMVAHTRALLAWRRGALDVAERHARDAAATWRDAGARLDTADGVEALGTLACARGRWEEGVRLLGAAEAARQRLGYRGAGPAACRAEAAAAAEAARRELGESAVSRLWAEGAASELEEAVDYARRGTGGRKRPDLGWPSLTPTEMQVVGLVAEGLRNDAIAQRLYLSPGTVKNHLSHIFTKLGVTNRAELAAEVRRQAP